MSLINRPCKGCSHPTICRTHGCAAVEYRRNKAAAAAAECCEQCDDGNGHCAFPYYGVAPHVHAPGPILGSTRMLGPESWPANFAPDAEEDNTCGTYTHCLACGRPNVSGNRLAPTQEQR
jgi:hypothetical protein